MSNRVCPSSPPLPPSFVSSPSSPHPTQAPPPPAPTSIPVATTADSEGYEKAMDAYTNDQRVVGSAQVVEMEPTASVSVLSPAGSGGVKEVRIGDAVVVDPSTLMGPIPEAEEVDTEDACTAFAVPVMFASLG